MEWIDKHRRGVTIGGVMALVVIIIAVVAGSINSIYNDGWERQRSVIEQYNIYQTSMSTCLDNSNVGAQIASEEYKQAKDLLTAVAGARYGEQGALNASSTQGAFISALQEQNPEIDRSLWRQLMTTAIGCRNGVADVNNELQSVASRFDTWANTGSIFAKPIRSRFPNDDLKIQGLNGPIKGVEALDFLVTPITTSEAARAIQTQEMPTQELFGDDS